MKVASVPEPLTTIDCDVHCAIPNVEALFPYLSSHWRAYLQENYFKIPQAVGYTYPNWVKGMATSASNTSLKQVRTNVLSHVSLALLNCYFGIESQRNPYLASDLATAVNRWMQEERLARDSRFIASIVVAPHDTAAAVAEIRRLGDDRRFVQVLIPARAWEPYGNRRYWPIWEAAVERELAIAIHFGGLAGYGGSPVGAFSSYFEEYAGAPQLFGAHLLSLIAEGVFEQYPGLRICLVESGVAWLPTLLWKLDTDWKGHRREIPWVRRRPSEYVGEHVRLTLEPFDAPDDPRELEEVLDQLKAGEMLMYASDFPHRHNSGSTRALDALAAFERDRVLRGNAMDFYGLNDRLLPAAATRLAPAADAARDG